jgi:Ca2+-transporting ATPase
MGRRIFDNIKKAMSFALAVHIPIAGLTLLSVLAMWPLILLPAHIAFLQLIIDPACSIVFEAEPEEKGIMNRRPRNPKDRMFSKKMVLRSLLQGVFVLFAVAVIFKASMFFNHTEGQARALSFTSLVIASLCLIMTNISKTESALSLRMKNTALYVVVVGSLVLLALLLTIPLLRGLFMFEPIGVLDLIAALVFGIASVAWFEIIKAHQHMSPETCKRVSV